VAVSVVTIPLTFNKPPLSMNDRMHYMKRARIVRQIREEVTVRLRAKRVAKPAKHVTVEFHYRPRDNRTRDPLNLAPTQKACVDAIGPGTPARVRGRKVAPPVPGYGLVPGDDPRYLQDTVPTIHPANKNPACWLRLIITYPEEDQ